MSNYSIKNSNYSTWQEGFKIFFLSKKFKILDSSWSGPKLQFFNGLNLSIVWYDLTGWLDIKEVWIGCLEDELVRPNTTFVVEVTEAIEAVEVGRMTADVRFGDRVVSVVDILGTEIPGNIIIISKFKLRNTF